MEFIFKDGCLRAIYEDGMESYLNPLGVSLERASHVEWDTSRGQWGVDLSPVGGELYFTDNTGRPFRDRSHALEFEKQWLVDNWIEGEETSASTESKKRRISDHCPPGWAGGVGEGHTDGEGTGEVGVHGPT